MPAMTVILLIRNDGIIIVQKDIAVCRTAPADVWLDVGAEFIPRLPLVCKRVPAGRLPAGYQNNKIPFEVIDVFIQFFVGLDTVTIDIDLF